MLGLFWLSVPGLLGIWAIDRALLQAGVNALAGAGALIWVVLAVSLVADAFRDDEVGP